MFKDIGAMYEYEEGQRSKTHGLWCWTLFLMRHMLDNAKDTTGFFGTALQFLARYHDRITKTLKFPGYSSPTSNQPLKYSLAVSVDSVNRT